MEDEKRVSRRRLLRYGSIAGSLTLAGCQGSAISAEQDHGRAKTVISTEIGMPAETPDETQDGRSTRRPTETTGEWEAPVDLCRSDPTLSSPGPLKAEFISREKYKCAGRPLDNFENLDPWTADVGTLTTTERGEVDFEGSRAAELRSSPGDKRVQISRRFEGGVDLSRWDLSLGTRLSAPDHEQVIVEVLAPDRKNKLVLVHPLHSQWGWVRIDLGPSNVTGSPDLADVREIQISVYTGIGYSAKLVVDSLRATPRANSGRVILTFDDNSVSQYETVLPILQQYDYPAVVGVAPWDVDETPDDMTLDQLQDLQSAGWDIASYPKKPRPISSVPPLEQEDRIREAKQWLIDHGFVAGARFLLWPSTDFDHHSLRIASRYHYLGFTGAPSISGQLLTSPTKTSRTAMDKVSLSEIERLLDLANEYNQLMVLTAHGIGDGDGMVDEAKFESIVEHLSESEIRVDTASTFWETIFR